MKLDELVNEDKIARALHYLAESDERCASLKADVARTEYLAKLQEAFAFKEVSVGTVEDRKSESKMSPKAQAAWDAHFTAVAEYEKVRAIRERAALTIDLFRTLAANRRVGNV